jgi:hypothetical protein
VCKRQALDRGNADAEPRERARPRGDGVQRDVPERHAADAQQIEDLTWQPARMRHVGGADMLAQERPVTAQRNAACVRAGVERQDGHVSSVVDRTPHKVNAGAQAAILAARLP